MVGNYKVIEQRFHALIIINLINYFFLDLFSKNVMLFLVYVVIFYVII